MFKKLRIKIIVAVMSALLILFSGTLGVIYGSSYYEILADNQKMLERYARDYSLTEQSSDNKPSDMELNSDGYKPVLSEVPPPDDDVHKFEISTFYSVALSDDNEVLII